MEQQKNSKPQFRLFKSQDEIQAYVKKMNENHKKLTSSLPTIVNEQVVGIQGPIHTNVVEGGNRKKLHKTRKLKK